MKTSYTTWKGNFQEFANKNNATLKIIQSPSMGAPLDYLELIVSSSFKNYRISILQRFIRKTTWDEGSNSFLRLEYSFLNKKKLNISLSKKDWMDSLFCKRKVYLEIKEMDSTFSIQSSNKQLALKFFHDSKIQAFFLKNLLIVFNIETKKGTTFITLKDLEDKLHTQNELQYLWDEFKYMIEIILNNETSGTV